MTDDADLIRLFAEQPVPPDDDAFVAGVAARIARRGWLMLAPPFVVVLIFALGVWATWPAVFAFSAEALRGIRLIANGVRAVFDSPAGMAIATVLLATAAFWTWLYERVRGVS
ncbi:MAG: hypothetical protein WDM91_20535 [Rhizomicrobium sp.]